MDSLFFISALFSFSQREEKYLVPFSAHLKMNFIEIDSIAYFNFFYNLIHELDDEPSDFVSNIHHTVYFAPIILIFDKMRTTFGNN